MVSAGLPALFVASLFVCFSAWALPGNGSAPGTGGKPVKPVAKITAPYLPNTIILKVKPAYRSLCTNTAINLAGLGKVLQQIGASHIKKQYPLCLPPAEPLNPDGKPYADLSLIYRLTFSAQLPIEQVIERLEATGLLLYAEPSFMYRHCVTINDPSAGAQYHLNLLKMYQAWDITQGDTNVVVGIVDSGSDITHPDLQFNLKYNYDDPIDGTDNDSDGYVDNFQGWDLAGADVNNIVGDNNPEIMGNNNVHGSHVSGISTASTNNGIGGAGIAYKCKFLPVKCAADNDSNNAIHEGYIITGYEGITYAADHGAKVINCSWGGEGFSQQGQDVITYAGINRGALVVCAAGNSNSTADFYPADFEGVVSVAASNSTDQAAGFTNHNYKVAVTAPGVGIYSTLWRNTYANFSGTSMASPVVAGLAALAFSVHPTFTPAQMRLLLMATSDTSLYAVPTNRDTAYADRLGSGRVNAFAAVTAKPSGITLRNITLTDHNDNIFVPGDTIYISGRFYNMLYASTHRASARIFTTSPFLQALSDSFTVGVLAAGAGVNVNSVYRFKVLPGIPYDDDAVFNVKFRDSAQAPYKQTFDQIFRPDYSDISSRNISTTITSNGRIGYVFDNATTGQGFKYKTKGLAYEIGLITATGQGGLSNTVRNDVGGYDNDFVSQMAVHPRNPAYPLATTYNNTFNDAAAGSTRIKVSINQVSESPNTAADTNFIIVKYTVSNQSGQPINNFYIGLFADFDVSTGGTSDRAEYDAAHKLGYVHSTAPGGLYAGIANLDFSQNATFNAIPNAATGSMVTDFGIYDGFSDAEKIMSVGSGISRSSAPADPLGKGDVSIVNGIGPYSLAPSDSMQFGFILCAGQNLTELQTAVSNARTFIPTGLVAAAGDAKISCFPNPATGLVTVTGLPETGNCQVQLTDALGRSFAPTLQLDGMNIRFNTQALPNGIYSLKAVSGSRVFLGKISVQH